MENRINSMGIIPRAMSGKECEEYILDYANNYLYKDCGSGECEFISDLELEKGCNGFEYSEIIKLGDDIIAVPNYSKSFLIYNVEKKTIRHIYVDKKLYENNVGKPGFHKIIPYENKIFCIKYICNAIVCIDKKTLEITYTDIFDDIKQDWNLFKVVGDCYSYDGLLYIPLMDTNIFVVFDMEKCTHEIKQLYEDINMATVGGCGDEMYLVDTKGKKVYTLSLSKWQIQDTMNITEPDGFTQEVHSEECNLKFIGSFYYKKQLWLIPYARSNMIVRADLVHKCTECGCQYDMSQVLNYSKDGNVLLSYTDKGTIQVDLNTSKTIIIDYFHSQKSARAYWIHKLNYSGMSIMINESWLPLDKYIEHVVRHGKMKEIYENKSIRNRRCFDYLRLEKRE